MAVYLGGFLGTKQDTIEDLKKHVAEKKIVYPVLFDQIGRAHV